MLGRLSKLCLPSHFGPCLPFQQRQHAQVANIRFQTRTSLFIPTRPAAGQSHCHLGAKPTPLHTTPETASTRPSSGPLQAAAERQRRQEHPTLHVTTAHVTTDSAHLSRHRHLCIASASGSTREEPSSTPRCFTRPQTLRTQNQKPMVEDELSRVVQVVNSQSLIF